MTVISTETMSSVAQSILRSQLFQRPCLGTALTHRQRGGRGLPLGGLSALRGRAAQRDLSSQAARSGSGVERRRAPVQLLLRDVSASRDAGVGAVLRPPFPRRPAVRHAWRAGLGSSGAASGDRASAGDPDVDAEALAAVVAGAACGHTAVADSGRGAGGAARQGAAALAAGTHSGPGGASAAVAQPDLAQALDRAVRAPWGGGPVRRKCF